MDPQTGAFTDYPAPTPDSSPFGITAGPDGNLWFTEPGANQIGRITPDGEVTEFAVPTTAAGPANGILTGPDGNIWFTEEGGNNLGEINPADPGVITEYAVPTPNSTPNQFTVGPDGNLWFDEESANQVGQFVFDGPTARRQLGHSRLHGDSLSVPLSDPDLQALRRVPPASINVPAKQGLPGPMERDRDQRAQSEATSTPSARLTAGHAQNAAFEGWGETVVDPLAWNWSGILQPSSGRPA
jgi:hypothetical protein